MSKFIYCMLDVAFHIDIHHPWREGKSTDGRDFEGTIPYISSLDFTTNGACQPWTAILSIIPEKVIILEVLNSKL